MLLSPDSTQDAPAESDPTPLSAVLMGESPGWESSGGNNPAKENCTDKGIVTNSKKHCEAKQGVL